MTIYAHTVSCFVSNLTAIRLLVGSLRSRNSNIATCIAYCWKIDCWKIEERAKYEGGTVQSEVLPTRPAGDRRTGSR